MKACAPTLVATCTKLLKDVPQVQALVSDLFDAQWYSSESEPPGKRRIFAPTSLSSEAVATLSRVVSHTSVLKPNQRASAIRMAWIALSVRFPSAGACLGM